MTTQNESGSAELRDFKLIVDNQLKKGHEKLIRFGGEVYSSENHGQGVVIIRDPRPRMNRLWSKREICDLKVPRYKVDTWYVGEIPLKEVTFSKLNDNINRQFMEQMCRKFGKLERVKVYHHPKTQKHMGLSKAVFTSQKAAAECASALHMTSVMGNIIHAEVDPKECTTAAQQLFSHYGGELLNKMYQKICRGEMLAETMPDVIRHTQEKAGCRQHASKRDRRKSSHEDPRKLQAKNSGPKTPPMPTKPEEKPQKEHVPLHKSKSTTNLKNNRPDVVDEPVNQSVALHTSQSADNLVVKKPELVFTEDQEINKNMNGAGNQEHYTSEEDVRRHEVKHKKKKERKKKKDRHKARSRNSPSLTPERKHKNRPRKLSTTDLEARINSLLNEQSDRYHNETHSNSSRSISRANSYSGSVDENQIDLEDGECSSVEEKQSKSPLDDKIPTEATKLQNTGEIESSVNEFSSPNFSNSQKFIEKRDVSDRRTSSPPPFERERSDPIRRPPSPRFKKMNSPERGGRYSPSPQLPPYHHNEGRLSPYSMERERLRRSPHHRFSPPRNGPMSRFPNDHMDRRFPDRHRHSPPFDHRRHSPEFDRHFINHRRSPEFAHRGRTSPRFGYNGPRHHFSRSPGRGELRRSISPDHRKSSRFSRRSPNRYPSNHYNNHHPRPGSPHHPDFYRRRRSPEYNHRGMRGRYSPGKRDRDMRKRSISPNDDDRDRRPPRHRELPAEFRERWSQYDRRSPGKSPPPRGIESPRSERRRRPSYSPSQHSSQSEHVKHEPITHRDSSNSERISDAKFEQKDTDIEEKPLMSLDQRLREMTGDAGVANEEITEDIKTVDIKVEPSHSDHAQSVDMDISDAESDNDKKPKVEPPFPQHNHNVPPVYHDAHQARPVWDHHRNAWVDYGPRHVVPNSWGRPDDVRNYHQDPHGRFIPRPSYNGNPFPPNHPMYAHYHDRARFGIDQNRPWQHGHEHLHHDQFKPQYQPEWNHLTGQWQHPQGQPEMLPEEMRKKEEQNRLTDRVMDNVIFELKGIINRDLNRKVIESMAFKVYENWWDDNEKISKAKLKPAKQNVAIQSTSKPEVKPELPATSTAAKSNQNNKLAPSVNTFDPVNWAKNSFGMEGFGIGLGLRSALSTMPSFRIKKKAPSPSRAVNAGKNHKHEKVQPHQDRDYRDITNVQRPSKPSSSRHHKRVDALDSEGEDEQESDELRSEVSSEEEDFQVTRPTKKKAPKNQVLQVDEIFSSSSESETESELEHLSEPEEESSTEESSLEEEVQQTIMDLRVNLTDVKQANNLKRKIESPVVSDVETATDDVPPPIKKSKDALLDKTDQVNNSGEKPLSIIKPVTSNLGAAASLLSPTANNVAGNVLTPNHLKHVHPKKRHRLVSQEDIRNLNLIADVSEKLRSDDEVSMMSDKEKCALEALTDMKKTPDRRLSSQSSDYEQHNLPQTPGRQLSEPGVFSPPLTPLPKPLPNAPGNKLTTLDKLENKDSGQELEAVQALLSIKQSNPPFTPISPATPSPKTKKRKVSTKKQTKDSKKRIVEQPTSSGPIPSGVKPMPYTPGVVLTPGQKTLVLDIAAEHNYFKTQEQPPLLDLCNLTLSLLYAEHNYSAPYTLDPKYIQDQVKLHNGRLSPASTLSADTLVDVEEESQWPPLEIMTAAERVKLRRESRDTDSKKKSKSTKKLQHIDDVQLQFSEEETQLEAPAKTYQQEMDNLFSMWRDGLDLEDMKYLREVYESCLSLDNPPEWVNDTLWHAHPVTMLNNTKTPKKKSKNKDEVDAGPHKTGCSRSEGFYRLEDKAKLKQRRVMYRQVDRQIMDDKSNDRLQNTSTANRGSAKESGGASETSREARHLMRRIASEFGSDAGDLFKYNQLMFRKKAVKFKRSSIHGWGLFAEETIGADEMVIEYVGQVVRTFIAEKREVDYTKRGIGSSYLFRIDTEHIIDATKCGNYARFMNHSCNPSCYAKVITVDSMKKIVIYSKQTIKKNDEITYDYKFPLEDDKIPCYCGASNCRGTLN